MISKKVTQFNESLLKNGKTESDGDSSDSENEEDVAPVVNSESNNGSAEQYYTSGLWKEKVDNTLTAIGEIEQPQHPNAQASQACPTRSNRITSWHFPPQYSQSTLIGRLGSNACTFIALTYC